MVQKVERAREGERESRTRDTDCIKGGVWTRRPSGSGSAAAILAVYFKDQKKTWGKKHLFNHRSDISADFVANYLLASLKFRILGKFLLSECSTSQGAAAASSVFRPGFNFPGLILWKR